MYNQIIISVVRIVLFLVLVCSALTGFAQRKASLSGKIISRSDESVPYAAIVLKGTGYGCSSNEPGMDFLHAPAGKCTLVVSAIGKVNTATAAGKFVSSN